MIITKVIEYDKKKVLVQIDEHFTFPLYKTELHKYHITENNEICEKVYREILDELLPKRVKLRAMKLLEKRPYTRETLRRKLLEGKYPECLVDDAMDYVEGFHYIDDLKYAEDYIHCYASKRSRKQITQELMRKGVSKADIDSAWSSLEEANETIDEVNQVLAILRKKNFDISHADYKEKCKMFQYLYRKGYDINCIQKCMQFEENYSN